MNNGIVTKKDLLVLEFLFKFRVAGIEEVAILLNRKTITAYKRMQKLNNMGLVKSQIHILNRQIYFLSQQGHNLLMYNSEEINIKKINLLHEIFISKVGVLILRDNDDLELKDIYTERDLFTAKEDFFEARKESFPDLYIPKKNILIEYERTLKTTERMQNKMKKNFDNYLGAKQMWILSKNRKKAINFLSKSNMVDIIISEEYINKAMIDKSKNLNIEELI